MEFPLQFFPRGFNPYDSYHHYYGYFFGGRDRRRGGLLAALALYGHWQNLPAWTQRRMHATLGLVGAMILIYMLPHGSLLVPDLYRVCLQPTAVIRGWQWDRLLWFPWLHFDDIHLYFNMASLIWKGRILEPKLRSRGFLLLIAELCATAALLHLAAAVLLAALGSPSFMRECTVGFSGVLFGLKVVIARLPGPDFTTIAGVRVQTKYAAWGELLLCYIFVPDSSLLGHLCGILAGLAHVHGLWRNVRQTRLWQYLTRVWRVMTTPTTTSTLRPGPNLSGYRRPPRRDQPPAAVPKPDCDDVHVRAARAAFAVAAAVLVLLASRGRG